MKTHALRVGILSLGLYMLCLAWRLTITDPAVMNFHLLSLKTLFPGFLGYDALSVIWGGILSFAYGFLGSLVFHSFHHGCCLPKEDKKKRDVLRDKNYLLFAGLFIVGLLFGMLLTGFNTGYANSYVKDSATMMKNNGSIMMQMGQMMMGAGTMMSDRGQKYSDTEMMQKGSEMMQKGQELQGSGSSMMERGTGMMQMMGQ